jgi:lysophospholipase L1-like esterase
VIDGDVGSTRRFTHGAVRRGSRTWVRKALLAVIGTFLGAVFAEGALRLAGFSYVTFEKPDLTRGVVLAANTSGWQKLEGEAYVAINSHGYRDRERSKAKAEGVFRIAVLGDSFVEARQVALEDTFCARLERTLSQTPAFAGRTVEVLNFGVSGYGTAQELLTLREDVLAFAPDYVLLAFFPANDVSDNSKTLSDPWRTIPYYTLRDDELVLDTSFRESPAFKDRYSTTAKIFFATQEHFRLVQLLYRMRGDIGELVRDGMVHASPFSEPGLPNRVYQEPAIDSWREAWRVTERLLRKIAADLGRRDIGFGVVTLSTPPQADPDIAVRRRFQELLQVDDLFYPDRRIRALGDEVGFPVLNLGEAFQMYADAHQTVLHGFPNTRRRGGHWNAEGHRLAAEMIAPWLLEMLGSHGEGAAARGHADRKGAE